VISEHTHSFRPLSTIQVSEPLVVRLGNPTSRISKLDHITYLATFSFHFFVSYFLSDITLNSCMLHMFTLYFRALIL
jgi:hypothetical protein